MIFVTEDSESLLLMMNNKLFDFDLKQRQDDFCLIGTDEAGRGPGAGPVCAAAVCFKNIDKNLISTLSKLNDSKQLSEKTREELFNLIIQNSVYSITFGSVEEIEKNNILKTSLNCMKKACLEVVKKLESDKINVLIDGNKLIHNFKYSQKYIVKGDGKSASIAAASILAKVSRDKYMVMLAKDFPQYGWAKNKGYLTAEHLAAIDEYGTTVHHRSKFLEKHFAKQLSLF